MTKRKRDQRIIVNTDERIVPAETEAKVEGETTIHAELPEPKRYTPPNCSMCTAMRPKPEESYVTVTSTQRQDGFIFRYCKCGFCGNTFKESERI